MLQIEASRVSHARELTFDEIHACVRAHGCTLLENPGSEKPHKNVLYIFEEALRKKHPRARIPIPTHMALMETVHSKGFESGFCWNFTHTGKLQYYSLIGTVPEPRLEPLGGYTIEHRKEFYGNIHSFFTASPSFLKELHAAAKC